MRRLRNVFMLLTLVSTSSLADCYDVAGKAFGIDADLLRAIAFKESSLRDDAVNFVSEKNYALGRMQIHSNNFKHLEKFGITPDRLKSDGCINTYVGAYYLSLAINRLGNNWRAVGAYNAGFASSEKQEQRRQEYAKGVQQVYNKIKSIRQDMANN